MHFHPTNARHSRPAKLSDQSTGAPMLAVKALARSEPARYSAEDPNTSAGTSNLCFALDQRSTLSYGEERLTMRTLHQYCAFIIVATALALTTMPAMAQGGVEGQLADKLASVKQSLAQNQQNLHHYQWTETTQVTLKGEPKPPKQFLCQYGPDGQVQKTPIASPGMQPSQGGRFKQRMVKKKTEEMQDYMGDVKTLLSVYVPPDPVKLQQASQAGNASIGKGSAPGTVKLTFDNYDKNSDQLAILFNTQQKKISHLSVKTYMQQPSDAVTLETSFASLADGTNYAEKTVLNMAAKKMVVTTTNSHYQKIQ
jgi:uncharacterized protein YdbL (DUF1318 family)